MVDPNQGDLHGEVAMQLKIANSIDLGLAARGEPTNSLKAAVGSVLEQMQQAFEVLDEMSPLYLRK